MMQTLSVAVLSYGLSVGVAFAPPSVMPISNASAGSSCLRRCSTRGPVPCWIQRRHKDARARNVNSRRLLFSRDQNGPIMVVESKKSGRGALAVTKSRSNERVSQRVEQDQVLGKMEKRDGLRVRTGRGSDMMQVARLCVDTFRGPFEWWMQPLRVYRVGLASCVLGAAPVAFVRVRLGSTRPAVDLSFTTVTFIGELVPCCTVSS